MLSRFKLGSSTSLLKTVTGGFCRFLNIHEHQSHEILREHGVHVPGGKAATAPEEARKVAEELGYDKFVVKAQILAGGRGLGTFKNGFKGGVHLTSNAEGVEDLARKMIGQVLVTKQTGPEGKPVSRVYVSECVQPKRELYFAILMDRTFGGPVMVGSTKGGVSIEDVAKETPEAIHTIPIDFEKGIQRSQAERMAHLLEFPPECMEMAIDNIMHLYDVLVKKDATMVEINPMIETEDKKVLCADAKINFDDNASFRQKSVWAMRDLSQEDPFEVSAAKYDLNFVKLDGSIGCMVNGAGLAMATMDIIKLHGGNPANFLDVGGGADEEQVREALKIVTSDPKVKAIFVNIFGGIMRCDILARGIVNAVQQVGISVPLVVRMKGTNVELGKKILKESGLKMYATDDLTEGAKLAVKAASERM
uniref:Succinate--CoA ligase [ADP-forming] subunit beta, mitochondrial n=1 Tax=Stygiella incarcerata TaxID=1712417 RepID=A0A192ZIJ9_9EUKA|nr:succinate thiokinase subunit B [Stygiella incarcerata]